MIYCVWNWTLPSNFLGLNPDSICQLTLIRMIYESSTKPVKKSWVMQGCRFVVWSSPFVAVIVCLLCSTVTRMRFRVVHTREGSRSDDRSWWWAIKTSWRGKREKKRDSVEDCMQGTINNQAVIWCVGNHFQL